MNSTVTVKYQTTIPKAVLEQLSISISYTLEWIVEKGKVVVTPVHNNFLRYQESVKVGAGDIAADIQAAREGRMEKYRN
jgi:bifunctional DNA-binding transcriptional regulator/antitoxin component of YhaV-PrlF toxin-antitoxin module